MQNITALLLAAGESSRMGQPKALLQWNGITLIRYQVYSLLEAEAWPIIVVTGHRHKDIHAEIPPQTTIVLNKNYKRGRSSSVKTGLQALGENTSSIAILGVDQPRSSALLRYVFEEHQKAQALISRPTYKGESGHPVIFNRCLLPELLHITERSRGLRDVVHRHKESVNNIEVATTEILLDLNFPEEYQSAIDLQEEN